MKIFRLLSAALAACALAACGSSAAAHHSSSAKPAAAPSSTAAHAATHVLISNFSYRPAKLTVGRGAQVTFTNHDQTPHTATSTATGFDTGSIAPGASRTVTLDKPGTYTYFCQFHAFMRAVITVR